MHAAYCSENKLYIWIHFIQQDALGKRKIEKFFFMLSMQYTDNNNHILIERNFFGYTEALQNFDIFLTILKHYKNAKNIQRKKK